MKKRILLTCALLVSVITLSDAANRSFRTEMEQWNPIGITQASNGMTQAQSGPQTTNRLTAGSAILPTVATAAPSGELRGGSTNVITFTTAKAVGETVELYMKYSGAAPTLSGATGTPKSGKDVTYTLTSQTVTITGDAISFGCDNNQLTALDVSKNTALISLFCSNNQLTALDVSQNTALRTLDCDNNQLTALDVSRNTALTVLQCDKNQLTTLDVSRNTALTKLSCYKNQLKALVVSKNTALEKLYCTDNQLTTLDVSLNTALTELACDGNQLTALDVSQNTALIDLHCMNNQLKALDVSKNTKLVSLYCRGNQIKGEEMTRLVNSLPNRMGSWLTGIFAVVQEPAPEGNICLKSDVVIAKGKNWKTQKYKTDTEKYVAYEGEGASPSVMSFTTAKEVAEKILLHMKYSGAAPTLSGATGTPESGKWIAYTLTSQTVTIQGDVTELYCSDNQLTTLDVSRNTALTALSCGNNQLTALDVSQNTKLTHLYCRSNQLTALDVSKNAKLTYLDCWSNKLTAMDVSQNTALTYLNCSGNQIKGKKMTRLVNGLPDRTGKDAGDFAVVQEPAPEGNICLKSDVAIAKSKNWNTQKFNSDTEESVAYEGEEASPNIMFFTTAKAVGETVSLFMAYSGAAPTLSGATGTPESGKYVTYTLTSQYVTITGEVNHFSCRENKITTLDVSMNTALKDLACNKNQLTALDVNTALEKLDCTDNQLTALDVSKNTALIWLWCSNNQLKALDVSKNDTKLELLICFGNQIKGEEMTRLVNSLPDRTGRFAGTFTVVQEPAPEGNICLKSDVAIAKGKNWKTQKYKSDTKEYFPYEGEEASLITFTTAKEVGESVKLKMTYTGDAPTLSGATGTPKSGTEVIYKLTSQTVTITGDVTFLDCSYNQLTALDVSKNTALTTLNCFKNQLTALDITQNIALTELYCSNNQLTALDVSKNTALTSLGCSYNQLTALDVSKNTALTELYCSHNPLTTLNVSKNTALTELDCSDNPLSTLDVSKNTALTELDCSDNPLSTLDVSKNTALTMLDCSDNQLTALDVSQNTALTGLNCSDNQLTALDASKNTALAELDCSHNQLTALDVSQNTSLTWFSCSGNQIKGEEMTRLVNSLPDRTGKEAGEIVVVQSGAESNRCLKSDVAIAKSRNWNTQKYNSDTEEFVAYEGEKPIPYAVTLTKEGEGTLTATGADNLDAVPEGTELTIVATPAAGYELTALTANSKDIRATKKFTVTADTEVKATFSKMTAVDVVEAGSVCLYPNPASTYVNVKATKADALVRLYDANGTLRYEARTAADGTLQIDLSAYAEGTYLLRVGDDAQRLLVQR